MSMLSARLAASVARNLPRSAQQVCEIKGVSTFSKFSLALMERKLLENCITIIRFLSAPTTSD